MYEQYCSYTHIYNYNACVGTAFAYGQTSSGKTYTMNGWEKDPGIIPRAVEEVFRKIQMVSIAKRVVEVDLPFIFSRVMFDFEQFYPQASDREFLIRVSYMEIYNEEINDLLVVENQKLQIHESLEVSLLCFECFLIYKVVKVYEFILTGLSSARNICCRPPGGDS